MEEITEAVGRGKIRTDFTINIPTLMILLAGLAPVYYQFFQVKQNTENIETNRQAIVRVEQKIDNQTRFEIDRLRDEITTLKINIARLEEQRRKNQ